MFSQLLGEQHLGQLCHVVGGDTLFCYFFSLYKQ